MKAFKVKLKISQKLPILILSAAFAVGVGIGIASYLQASRATQNAIDAKLSAVLEARHLALADYLSSIEQDMRYTATSPLVRAAVVDFATAWDALGHDQTERLQKLYIHGNPHPTGQKENLDAADDGSLYSEFHAKYHPWFRHFLRERDYYDIFLFDPEGNLVYTVFKELDYATNLNSGEWKDSDLGNAFRAARSNPTSAALNFFDFMPYAPSHDAPASFISTPILGADNTLLGVLVFQMPINRINAVMRVTAGLGESGETFIVGGDHLMRNDSRFSEESTILAQKVESEAVQSALAGDTGLVATQGYRGESVLSAYSPFDFLGTRWAIVAEVAQSEALASVVSMRNTIFLIASILLLVIAALSVFLSRRITRAISVLTGSMRILADGDTSIEVPGLDKTDEVGEMAQAVQVFKDNAIKADRLERENAERERRVEEEKREATLKMADALEDSVGTIVEAVSAASGEMQATAQSMTATSEETSVQATAVAAASEEAATNVNTVAAATEELSASVGEISRQVAKSSEITGRAVAEADRTSGTVQGMAEAAQKIGDVVDLIRDIAEQTNLLALNATIEAARAGEAGKGFAVVASEVKSLATQTAKATEEISSQITGMQTITGDTVGAIESIREIITEVNGIAGGIASAVEEQSAATQDIAGNIQQAAQGTQEVSANISGVTQSAGEAGQSANQVLQAAGTLTDQSKALRQEIDKFLATIRAA